jgi:hypothetical protein
LRSSLLSKDHLSQQREQAYNELWQVLASSNVLKNDKVLVQKLRELKLRHAEVIVSMQGGLMQQSHILLPEEEANVQKECA